MKLKTSTQIILKFQIFTVSILTFILFLLNTFYFEIWLWGFKRKWDDILRKSKDCNMPFCNMHDKRHKMFLEKWKWINWNIIKNWCFNYLWENVCLENRLFQNIYKEDDNYFFVHKNKVVFDITDFIEFQIDLLELSLFILIFYGIISYFVWYLFLQTVYKKLFKASKELEENNYINLENYNLADKDELNILFKTINKQIDSISSFNKYLSHELKTPLMNMSSTIELLYEKYKDEKLQKIKEQIFYIKDIIDTLNKLILIENKKLKINFKEIDLCKLIKKYYENIQCNKTIINTNEELMDIVIKNLIDNAKKYAIWDINIEITENHLQISNKTDKKLNIEKLTQKFYKQSNNWLWLWLYLVDKIVKLLNYKLSLEQEWNIFIVRIDF